MRWDRRAPPVPAAAGVNLLRSPAPGGGGGREGEGARAAGGSARGRRTRQRTGPARNRPEPPRAGGGAAGAPPPRNGPRAAEGGMAGRAPPVWALARQGGGRGCRKRPGAARERPRRGRGQATADPRQRRGLPMRPTLFAPAQTPGGGEHGAGGARSGGLGGGSRRKAGPQLRPPDAPLQGAPSTRDGVRRKRKAPRPWPGRFREGKLLAESTPCGSIVPQRRRCCQAPEGGGPLLDIRTLFRQRGALTGHCLGLPRPGRDDVPFPSAS